MTTLYFKEGISISPSEMRGGFFASFDRDTTKERKEINAEKKRRTAEAGRDI
ncbi:MAG: hypothetical protein ABII02_02650 [Candidatus Magasanikbacteria bacterium]